LAGCAKINLFFAVTVAENQKILINNMINADLKNILNQPIEAMQKKKSEEDSQFRRINEANTALLYGFPKRLEIVVFPVLKKILTDLKSNQFLTKISIVPQAFNLNEINGRPEISFFEKDMLAAWDGLTFEQIINRKSNMPNCTFEFIDNRKIQGRNFSVFSKGQVVFGLKKVINTTEIKAYFDARNGVTRGYFNGLDEITEEFIKKICYAAIDEHVNPENKKSFFHGEHGERHTVDGRDNFYDE